MAVFLPVTRYSKGQALKGKLLVQHSIGLGAQPNVIPPGEASVSGDLRTVQIGWHPVAGLGGKWFAEQTGLGKMITQKINHYPDPTQHWAVLVEDYVHQLWMVSLVRNMHAKGEEDLLIRIAG